MTGTIIQEICAFHIIFPSRYWDKQLVRSWAEVESALQAMPGLVETGLFVGMADTAYFGMQDGSVSQRNSVA